MNKTHLASLAAVTVFAFAPAAALAQHGNMHNMQHGTMRMHMQMGMSGMSALRRLSGRAFDSAFLSQMMEHHQGAVDMSRDALPTLKNAHVKKHAQNIIAGQQKEIAEMRTILQRDFKTQPLMAQMNLMKRDMQGMMAMKSDGDRMFLQMMIPHHRGANEMSRLALRRSHNAKVRSLAHRILKAQTAEIKDFRHLLRSGSLAGNG